MIERIPPVTSTFEKNLRRVAPIAGSADYRGHDHNNHADREQRREDSVELSEEALRHIAIHHQNSNGLNRK